MRKELLATIARRLLIAALVVSAVFLALRTDYFSTLWRTTLPAETAGNPSASADASAALRPRAVMACYADGGRAASAYDGETTREAFLHFAALLGEALGSAAAPEAIGAEEFRASAAAESVFVDLGLDVPLDLLTGWLGAGAFAAEGLHADVLFLAPSAEGVSLCFRDAAGGYWRCGTAAQAETLSARMADFQGADALFAWEDARLDGAEPWCVIPKEMPAVAAASAVSARDGAAPEQLLAAVGMNFFVASYYDEADGTAVYVQDEQTLRLSPDGLLSYRDGGGASGAAGSLAAAADLAYRLARESAGAYCADAELMFAGAETGADGAVTVYFDYCLNGIPVRLAEGHAAAVEVSGGTVTRASAALRRYTLTGAEETVLPMLRAAAIAAADGGAPALTYMDAGGSFRCVWVDE